MLAAMMRKPLLLFIFSTAACAMENAAPLLVSEDPSRTAALPAPTLRFIGPVAALSWALPLTQPRQCEQSAAAGPLPLPILGLPPRWPRIWQGTQSLTEVSGQIFPDRQHTTGLRCGLLAR